MIGGETSDSSQSLLAARYESSNSSSASSSDSSSESDDNAHVAAAASVSSEKGGLRADHTKPNVNLKYFSDENLIAAFAGRIYNSMDELRRRAKKLKLIITVTGRTKGDDDRVEFGLSKVLMKHVTHKVPKALFRWERHQRCGLYQPGKHNVSNVELYMRCLNSCGSNPHPDVRPRRKWLPADLDDLLEARCSPNPPSFKNIAAQLNRTHRRMNFKMDYPFTARELLNKWRDLFPPSVDANRTVQYLDDLKKHWPGLYFHPEKDHGNDAGSPPKLIGLHIVWPWSIEVMNTVAPNVFCDATYNVTVFQYKVVTITCLDGNRQHRPLMCSFITRSTGDAWAVVFDVFKRK